MRRMITMTGCLATAFAADAPARADAAPNQVRGTVVRFSGNNSNWPWCQLLKSGSASFCVNCEIWARPDF